MTDRDLLLQYLTGNRAAFDELVRRHIDMVFAAARRQVGPSHADDITQVVFIMLTRKAHSLRNRANLTGWLYRVTGYSCANLRKTESRRRKHERESAMSITPPAPADPEIADFLDAALNKLPEHDREVLLLHHLQQKSHAETALSLGISEEAARKLADRSLEKLRSLLARKGRIGEALPSTTIATLLASQAAAKASPALLASTLAAAHAPVIRLGLASLTKTLAKILWWRSAKVAATCAAAVILVAAALASPLLLTAAPTAPAPPSAADASSFTVAPDELAGRVLDESRKPIPDALISFPRHSPRFPDRPLATTTDANGVFRFPGYGKAGIFYLQVDKEGYATQWLPDVVVGKLNEIHLDKSTRLQGTITLPTGKPAEDATVTAVTSKVSARPEMGAIEYLQVSTLTDAQGHFHFLLEPNDYELQVKAANGLFARTFGIHVQLGKTAEQSLTLATGVHLKLRAVNSITGSPIPNVTFNFWKRFPGMILDEPGMLRKTDAEGIAEWDSLMPGPQFLEPAAAGYAQWSSPADDNPNVWTFQPFHLNLGPNLATTNGEMVVRMEPAMHLTGKVVDADGLPVPRIYVHLKGVQTGDYRYAKRTNASGQFELYIPASVIPPNTPCTLAVISTLSESNPKPLISSDSFTLTAGGSKSFLLRLPAQPATP